MEQGRENTVENKVENKTSQMAKDAVIKKKWTSEEVFEVAGAYIMRFISAWFLMSFFFTFIDSKTDPLTIDFVGKVKLAVMIGGTIVGVVAFSLIARMMKRAKQFDIILMFASALLYVLLFVGRTTGPYVAAGVAVVFAVVLKLFADKYEAEIDRFDIKTKDVLVIGGVITVLWLIYMSVMGILRYLTYVTPCFDMGIFAQMFYYMKETFTPVTTCERFQEMSHFAVHISPALYIFLPIYFIFPSPVTLVVIQAAGLASGAIPLYLLCKQKKMSNTATLTFVLAAIFYPALSGGCNYDFHENMMLFPCLLWLLYFMEAGKKLPFWLMLVLTLLIKEDAAVYVACIGLYMILGRKEYKKGAGVFGASVVWFLVALFLLSHFGEGGLTGRYSNYFVNGEDSIFSIFTTIFRDPAYFFGQIFTKEKLEYLLWIMVPLLGLPFITKKPSEYIFLIPMLVINLMTGHQYQYSIYFQYSFGTMALLFYMVLLQLERMDGKKQKKMTLYMCVISLIMGMTSFKSFKDNAKRYAENKETYQVMDSVLEDIPEEASVESTTFVVPKLSQRKEIYEYRQDAEKTCDYIIFDLIFESSKKLYNEDKEKLISSGYTQDWYEAGVVAVFKKSTLAN